MTPASIERPSFAALLRVRISPTWFLGMAMWIPVLMIACWWGLMTPDSHGVRSYPADPGVPWVGIVASLLDRRIAITLSSLVECLVGSSLMMFLRCLVASLY